MLKVKPFHSQPRSAPPTSKAQELLDKKKQESRDEDSVLIQRALAGDQRAFLRIRQKYQEPLSRLIVRIVRNKQAEVDDLTQEAFIKAFTSLASFNHEYAFSTWLYKIATNNAIDYIRKRKLQTFSIDKPLESEESDYSFEIPDTDPVPDQKLMASQRKKMLDDAMNSLPPKYRMVMMMRHVDEKEYQEIAKTLKLPLGTVKAHIFRAREMLYKQLKDKMRHY
jgi:RNA polymerase sigma factor (sigma-70 family)